MPVRIKDTNLVYFPAPKVACTSIKQALLEHNKPALYAELTAEAKEGRAPDVHRVYHSVPMNLMVRLGRRHGDRWFCVVRDPIERFVSGYRNRVLFHHDLKKNREGSGLSLEPSIDEFADQLSGYRKANPAIEHHFAPLVKFLGKKPSRFERIFDIRQMNELREYLRDNGVDVEFPRSQTGGPKMSTADLSADSVAKLREHYAEDYKIFGPYFEARK